MAVRKVTHHGRNIIGHFPSLKLNRMVMFESLLERDFICLLDYEPTVETFAEQPVSIHYQHEGRSRHYTPDFHVVDSGRNLLFECKPARWVTHPENQIKFAIARYWCQSQNWEFRIVTETQLAANWRVHNIKYLTQFARYRIESPLKARIGEFLATISLPTSVAMVMQAVQPESPQQLLIPILHMAFHREVHIPLNAEKITVNSWLALTPFADEKGLPLL